MTSDRLRILILFADAAMIASALQDHLEDDYDVVTLDDLRDPMDDLTMLIEARPECDMHIVLNEEPEWNEQKFGKKAIYKMPNADRQYLQKWQPR